VIYVMQSCPCPFYPPPFEPDGPDLILFLGPDQHGVPLEILALQQTEGDIRVIHAMKMTSKYADDFAGVMRCRQN
jgi:hypothetical protein